MMPLQKVVCPHSSSPLQGPSTLLTIGIFHPMLSAGRLEMRTYIKDLHGTSTHVCPITYIFHVQRAPAGRAFSYILYLYVRAAHTGAKKQLSETV